MKIFFISNFWVGQAGLPNIGRSITKLLNYMRGHESDLRIKVQPNWTKIVTVITFPRFLVGRLVGRVCMHQFLKLSKKPSASVDSLAGVGAGRGGRSSRNVGSGMFTGLAFPKGFGLDAGGG